MSGDVAATTHACMNGVCSSLSLRPRASAKCALRRLRRYIASQRSFPCHGVFADSNSCEKCGQAAVSDQLGMELHAFEAMVQVRTAHFQLWVHCLRSNVSISWRGFATLPASDHGPDGTCAAGRPQEYIVALYCGYALPTGRCTAEGVRPPLCGLHARP